MSPLCWRANATLLALLSVAGLLLNSYFRVLARIVPPPAPHRRQATVTSKSRSSSNSYASGSLPWRLPTADQVPCPESLLAKASSEQRGPKKSGPKFVFVVGLEGTGHHLHELLVKGSPSHKRIADLGIYHSVEAVSDLLFAGMGLMSLHCLEQDPKLKRLATNATDRCEASHTVCLHREVVQEMRNIRDAVGSESLSIFVNANGIMTHSMASYPSYRHKCRSLEYPILEFFYGACDEAGADCRHVYLYREPLEVIKSSQRRGFNRGPLVALQLYTTMLKVMQAQFLDRPSHVDGCFGLYDGNATSAEQWEPLRQILGWPTERDFKQFFETVYVPPAPLSEELKGALVPAKSQMYTIPYLQAHDKLLQLCRYQVAANKCQSAS